MSRTKNASKTPRGAPGKGRNRWTYEQRVCLHLLWTHERRPSVSERTRAFNHIYADHLAACGVPPPGLKSGTISAQYGELAYTTNKPTWKDTWGNVRDAPDTDEDRALRVSLATQIDGILQSQPGGNPDVVVLDITTPPETPLRTERVRTATQSPYIAYAVDDPVFGDTIDDTIHVATPPETPRRTERARKPTQNPYYPYTVDDPVTPVRSQGASGHPWAGSEPYATPGPSTRKRPADTQPRQLVDEYSDDLLNDDNEYFPQAKRTRSSPAVVVQPLPQGVVVQTPQTPTKRRKRPSRTREGATVRLDRPSGIPLMVTPQEKAKAERPLQDVTEEAAHPYPPGMLIRFSHSKSHGINTIEEGFVAGMFVPGRILVQPRGPPSCDTIDMNFFANHFNNGTGTDQEGIPSPFISTSNNLAWSTRLGLKRSDLGINFSVIDPSKLDQKAIYHALPFYNVLKKQYCFDQGFFGYRGTYEHLVWHKIPPSAIVKTYTLQDLIIFSNSDVDVKRVLRLDVLSMRETKTSADKIIDTLKKDKLRVDGWIAAAIGKIVIFLGLNHKSSKEMLSRAVFNIVQGWAIIADGMSQTRVDHFVKVFKDASEEEVGSHDCNMLKLAFLHGLQWSYGDLNVHLKGPDELRLMELRAKKSGQIDPSTLLLLDIDKQKLELDKQKREILAFGKQQRQVLLGPRQRLAIEEGQEGPEDQLGEDAAEDNVPRRLGRLNLQKYILYE